MLGTHDGDDRSRAAIHQRRARLPARAHARQCPLRPESRRPQRTVQHAGRDAAADGRGAATGVFYLCAGEIIGTLFGMLNAFDAPGRIPLHHPLQLPLVLTALSPWL